MAARQQQDLRRVSDFFRLDIEFPKPSEIPCPLLQLIEVSVKTPDLELSNVDVRIDMGTRVAILGTNGTAKSTLLNLLAGDLIPSKGEVRRSEKLRIGRFSKHFVDQLPMWKRPLEYLLPLLPDQNQEKRVKENAVRTTLDKFGLPAQHHRTFFLSLSEGQKVRVVLASIAMFNPHILLLDEPTNHLDDPTINALANALGWFEGGVVLVSHDSRLVSRVCKKKDKSEIWLVEDGTVTFFRGTFKDYQSEIKAREVDESVGS